jgi:hypothetical protein
VVPGVVISQYHEVGTFVEVSFNVTDKGPYPNCGVPVKFAIGGFESGIFDTFQAITASHEVTCFTHPNKIYPEVVFIEVQSL